MLTLVDGNLFTSPAKVLVNTVNTVGVMGKGIAKTFKGIYPQMFAEYQHLCVNSSQLWRDAHSAKLILRRVLHSEYR